MSRIIESSSILGAHDGQVLEKSCRVARCGGVVGCLELVECVDSTMILVERLRAHRLD